LLAIVGVLLYQIVAPLEERDLLKYYCPQNEAYARLLTRFVPGLWRRAEPWILF
jgi:protein-S-isoprenylcysteine O-methyltransferase Ste14